MEVRYSVLNGLFLCSGLIRSEGVCCGRSRNKGALFRQGNEDACDFVAVLDGLGIDVNQEGVAATIASTKTACWIWPV